MRTEKGSAYDYAITRVNRAVAKSYFKKGATIYLYPCKANVNSMWYSLAPSHIHFSDYESSDTDKVFECAVSMYEFYNCNADEGRYAKFFVADADIAMYEP